MRIQFCVDALHWSHLLPAEPCLKKEDEFDEFVLWCCSTHMMCAHLYEWICAWRSCMCAHVCEKAYGEFRKSSCSHGNKLSFVLHFITAVIRDRPDLNTTVNWSTGSTTMCLSVETFWLLLAPSGITKLIPVAPDNILRSYEAKWSVCARNTYLYIPHFSLISDDFFLLFVLFLQVTLLHQCAIKSFIPPIH